MKLEGLIAFVNIADLGSISEAARRLGVAKSVMSERLAELERSLDARLLQRTTRRSTLTEDGRALLERARRIVQDVDLAREEMGARRGALIGPLRISAPVSFGNLHLGPALYPFLKAHPEIELTLDLDDRFVDADADGYDAVIRHGPIGDSALLATRLAPSRRLLVAAPDYLAAHGTPKSIRDLPAHRAILYTNRIADWRFDGGQGNVTVQAKLGLRVNNGLLMRDAAKAGVGIALLPTFMVYADLHDGGLRAIDVGAEPEGAEIFLAYSKTPGPSAKLKALAAHLREIFGAPPYWDRGLVPEEGREGGSQTRAG